MASLIKDSAQFEKEKNILQKIGGFFAGLVKKKEDHPKEDYWEPPIEILETKSGAKIDIG